MAVGKGKKNQSTATIQEKDSKANISIAEMPQEKTTTRKTIRASVTNKSGENRAVNQAEISMEKMFNKPASPPNIELMVLKNKSSIAKALPVTDSEDKHTWDINIASLRNIQMCKLFFVSQVNTIQIDILKELENYG